MEKFRIQTGKYKGRLVDGEFTSPQNVKTPYGNYFFEPETIIRVTEKFEGHIILYCKGHYDVEGFDWLTGIRRIWSLRCGINIEFTENGHCDEFIANSLYKILQKYSNKTKPLIEEIHRNASRRPFQYENLNMIETLIMMYRSDIAMLQVKDKGLTLFELPKPNKRIFKKTIRGNHEFSDYEKV